MLFKTTSSLGWSSFVLCNCRYSQLLIDLTKVPQPNIQIGFHVNNFTKAGFFVFFVHWIIFGGSKAGRGLFVFVKFKSSHIGAVEVFNVKYDLTLGLSY